MTCIVITRGGDGARWRFDSVEAAGDHPLTQLGDAMLRSAEDVRHCFSLAEMGRLFGELGDERRRQEVAVYAGNRPSDREVAEFSEMLWRTLTERAQRPPADPAIICRMVVEDRRAVRASGARYRLPPTQRTTTMEAAETTTETAEPKAKKARPIPRAPKHAGTSVITFGKDKEGKPYGADNNPKKVGSASYDRFLRYTAGQTVEDAFKSGILKKDLNYDVAKGFIVLE